MTPLVTCTQLYWSVDLKLNIVTALKAYQLLENTNVVRRVAEGALFILQDGRPVKTATTGE